MSAAAAANKKSHVRNTNAPAGSINSAPISPRVADHYTLDKLLGSGGFGEVFLGRPKYAVLGDDTPSYVAIKKILVDKRERMEAKRKRKLEAKKLQRGQPAPPPGANGTAVKDDKKEDQKDKKPPPKMYTPSQIEKHRLLLRQEAKILKKFKHPNIIKYVDYLPREGHTMIEGEEAFITEYAPHCLDELPLPSVRIFKNIARQLFTVLAYLHGEGEGQGGGYKHLDLKPINILYSGTFLNPTLKLIDFGMCVKKDKRVGRCGTDVYMAPEIIDDKCKDEKADIWSAGITLIALYQGHSNIWQIDKIVTRAAIDQKYVEKGVNEIKNDAEKVAKKEEIKKRLRSEATYNLIRAVKVGKLGENGEPVEPGDPKTYPMMDRVPVEAHEFLLRCLVADPTERPSAEELLKDPWLNSQ
jgi:serine/threonine protein kinase